MINSSGIANGGDRCNGSAASSTNANFGPAAAGFGSGCPCPANVNDVVAQQAKNAPATYDENADNEDDMAATERELAEDAQWKRIQQNTFTRWANEHLKTVNKSIASLETDLEDGLRLITLIEVLSGKILPKHNKRPTFRSQKLENVSVALKFLKDEGIKLVNIGE